MSLKKPRQASNGKSSDQRYHEKGCRRRGVKALWWNRTHIHRNQTSDDDQPDCVLANRSPPFTQPQVRLRIATTLEQRSPAQGRKRGKDQGEIAKIENFVFNERTAEGSTRLVPFHGHFLRTDEVVRPSVRR